MISNLHAMTSKDLTRLRNSLENELRSLEMRPDRDTEVLFAKIKDLELVRKHLESKKQ